MLEQLIDLFYGHATLQHCHALFCLHTAGMGLPHSSRDDGDDCYNERS
jgi:hypothetical protein